MDELEPTNKTGELDMPQYHNGFHDCVTQILAHMEEMKQEEKAKRNVRKLLKGNTTYGIRK